MNVIYKYPIHFGTVNVVRNGNVIHFAKDMHGQLSAWIEHRGDDDTNTKLYIVGTGTPFDDQHIVHCTYIDDYGIVWHLVEDWDA